MMTLEATAESIPTTARPFPSIWAAAIWVFIFFALQIIIGILALFVAVFMAENPDGFAANLGKLTDMKFIAIPTIWGLVVSNLMACFGLWLYLRRDGRFAKIGFSQWSNVSAQKTLGLAALVIGVGLGFNEIYTGYIFPDVDMQGQLRALFEAIPKTIGNNILLFVAVAILAPLLEEFLFRGLLQNSLMPHMPAWAAILLSAAIFAAVHMDAYAFPPIFLLGAGFGYLYYVTGSLRVCILMHVINNGAAVLFS
jgi:membrane protease YdiL (CAAX protease family)